MIPRIASIQPMPDYLLSVSFDDGRRVALRDVYGLFQQVRLDESRTCVYWNEDIDLPSHAIYEYGRVVS